MRLKTAALQDQKGVLLARMHASRDAVTGIVPHGGRAAAEAGQSHDRKQSGE